jgi:hypothetical protein
MSYTSFIAQPRGDRPRSVNDQLTMDLREENVNDNINLDTIKV